MKMFSEHNFACKSLLNLVFQFPKIDTDELIRNEFNLWFDLQIYINFIVIFNIKGILKELIEIF